MRSLHNQLGGGDGEKPAAFRTGFWYLSDRGRTSPGNVRPQEWFTGMGWFSDLFKKGEDPEPLCTDAVLGPMTWSEDDEAWFGEHNGREFSLAYEWTKTPHDSLVVYARVALSDTDWLASSLAAAKKMAKEEYGAPYSGEIDSLSFGRIHFYLYKGKRRIIANLDGGGDDRSWRIEYVDRTCEGMGFDR